MAELLNSFGLGLNVAVIGATGGIGAAVVEALAASSAVDRIFACARAPAGASPKCTPLVLDLLDEPTIADATRTIAAEVENLHLVFITTGLLHDPETGLAPEKSLRALDPERLTRVIQVNAIGPALVAKHFLPLLPRERKSAFAAISARVGSIADNRLGGWHGYRASKAALNMFLRGAAIELARTHPQAICVALHPGTVHTRLSRPFEAGVKEGRLFTPDYSAQEMLSVLNRLTPDQSGGFFAYDGTEIAF